LASTEETDTRTEREAGAPATEQAEKLSPTGQNSGRKFRVEGLTAHAWQGISFLCLMVAALSLWRGHTDAAFVTATLGVVAWFLDLRNRLRRTSIEADDSSHESEIDEEPDEH